MTKRSKKQASTRPPVGGLFVWSGTSPPTTAFAPNRKFILQPQYRGRPSGGHAHVSRPSLFGTQRRPFSPKCCFPKTFFAARCASPSTSGERIGVPPANAVSSGVPVGMRLPVGKDLSCRSSPRCENRLCDGASDWWPSPDLHRASGNAPTD